MRQNRSIQESVIHTVVETELAFILIVPEQSKDDDGNPAWSCIGRTRTHIKGILPEDSEAIVTLLRNLADSIEETGIYNTGDDDATS